jgi:hypothetical protein
MHPLAPLLTLLLAASASALAQPAAPDASRIAHATVAAALKDLEARDGNGTIVTHPDGWTIVNEPAAAAQWSFVPVDHPAHPSVVRRVIRRAPDGAVSVVTAHLCEAPPAACEKMLTEFAAMNDRVSQAIKARGRQGSSQSMPPGPPVPVTPR